MYRRRTCRFCGRKFMPDFPNQRVHAGKCRAAWRRLRQRRYQRKYQRKVRMELKQGWKEIEGT